MFAGPLKHTFRLVFQCVVHVDGKKAGRWHIVAQLLHQGGGPKSLYSPLLDVKLITNNK